MNKIIPIVLSTAIIGLASCSSKPEPWDEEYKPDVPAALEYRVKKYEETVDDELCVFPDGLYVKAPDWICAEDKEGFALGTYSMGKTSYQYARNMAYLYAVREVTRKTSEEIRSLVKAYGTSAGGGDTQDEEVIQGISFKIASNVRVMRSVVSPNRDVYILVRVGNVEDALEGSKERMLWKAYRAKKANDELDAKYKEATWQEPLAATPQP